MDIHLNMKEMMAFNERRIQREEEETLKNMFMARKMQDRLINHYADVRRSKTYLNDMLKNTSFIKKVLNLQEKVYDPHDISMYFDGNGIPVVMTFQELADRRISERLESHKGLVSPVLIELLENVICTMGGVMYFLREVITDKKGNEYLLEIGLKSITVDLIQKFKEVSAELLIIDSRIDSIKNKRTYERHSDELSVNLLMKECISSVYNVNVFKMGCGKLKDYYIDGRVLRKKRMSDEDLIALFDPVQQQPKKNGNKTVEIKKNIPVESPVENIDSDISGNDSDDDNDSGCSGSDSDISGGSSGNDSDISGGSSGNDSDGLARQLFKFGFSTKIWIVERTSIINMVYNLYDNNSVFNEFINNNEYYKINIIKGLHHDKNNTNKSLHITAVFYNGTSYTKPYHLYVKDGAIVSMTEIRNLF